ncbi:MAG: hypothetical protein ABSC94_21290 [Polyangiaceae bacterium]|jgi:membrane protein implicated in regulation of membrane protease activity
MCPHCGRDAPILYRGFVPLCAVCGGLRVPLSAPSVNLAGRSWRFGGTLAGVAGGSVIVIGLALAVMVGGLLALFWSLAVALTVALPLFAVVLLLGLVLIAGGRKLRRSGSNLQRATLDRALLGLTQQRGAISAAEGAAALGVSVRQADDSLTELAKREPERVAVDVDEQGVVLYRSVSRFRVGPSGEEGASAPRGGPDASNPEWEEMEVAERAARERQ